MKVKSLPNNGRKRIYKDVWHDYELDKSTILHLHPELNDRQIEARIKVMVKKRRY